MTYNEFIKKHKGVAVDIDGAAGAQCVDLATAYFYEVFNSNIKNFWFDAHHFWDLFNNNAWLKKNMTKIENKPETVPQKGDVAVWKGSLNGGWGHIAICTGEGDTTYFYSYDQNWTGNHDACTKIKHNYNHIAGFLRPKDQSKIEKEATSNTKDKNVVPAGAKLVVDISQYQPKVDYAKLAKAVDGVIIRVGYRGWGDAGKLCVDPSFETHINGAIKNKIPYGFYFFSQATNAEEGKAEADFCYNLIKNYKPTYPVYFDSENSGAGNNQGRADKISKAHRTSAAVAFCKEINSKGFVGGIYASENWFSTSLEWSGVRCYSIWCAKYGSNNGTAQTKPTVEKYDGWQFTSQYSVSGIDFKVDMSYFYKVPASGNSKDDNKKDDNKKPKVTYKDYYVIATDGVNVRATPNGTIKSTLMYKAKVTCVVGSEKNAGGSTWIKTKSNTWIAKKYLSTTKPGTKKTTYTDYYVTATDGLNYRTSADGTVKGTLKKGTKVTIVDGSDKTANNLVWVKTKTGYWVAKKYLTTKKPTAAAPFKVNTDYTLQVDLKVRSGAGTGYAQKKTSSLTVGARKSAYNQTNAVLKRGTKVTALKVIKKSDKEYWVRIPSGYICAMQKGEKYIK